MEKIGIVVAMQEEWEEIEKIMQQKEKKQINNILFTKGKIQDQVCILAISGVGKVNAARTTQVLIDKFDIDVIINIGAAGAINPMLNIGDVLIGKYVVQHDFDITAFGHSKGYITGVGDRVLCDAGLIKKVEDILEKRDERAYKIKTGIVATGDIFVTDVEMRDKIRAKFKADVVDMECGAVAQVAYLNRKEFMVIRVISDTPNQKNASTFDENLKMASRRCSKILQEFLK